MNGKKAVKMCGECPTCRHTRAASKVTLRYRISRFIQRHACPFCRAANRELGRDFQKSPKLDA
jgi:ssDNA-binding Zn-finger/Zn-ribbon topoisomerase 1